MKVEVQRDGKSIAKACAVYGQITEEVFNVRVDSLFGKAHSPYWFAVLIDPHNDSNTMKITLYLLRHTSNYFILLRSDIAT